MIWASRSCLAVFLDDIKPGFFPERHGEPRNRLVVGPDFICRLNASAADSRNGYR